MKISSKRSKTLSLFPFSFTGKKTKRATGLSVFPLHRAWFKPASWFIAPGHMFSQLIGLFCGHCVPSAAESILISSVLRILWKMQRISPAASCLMHLGQWKSSGETKDIGKKILPAKNTLSFNVELKALLAEQKKPSMENTATLLFVCFYLFGHCVVIFFPSCF